MIMNDDLRDMIMRNASTDELRDAAQSYRHGHAARRRASSSCYDGTTTADEVIRETILEA